MALHERQSSRRNQTKLFQRFPPICSIQDLAREGGSETECRARTLRRDVCVNFPEQSFGREVVGNRRTVRWPDLEMAGKVRQANLNCRRASKVPGALLPCSSRCYQSKLMQLVSRRLQVLEAAAVRLFLPFLSPPSLHARACLEQSAPSHDPWQSSPRPFLFCFPNRGSSKKTKGQRRYLETVFRFD
jgi:hypothetical protein